MDPFPAAHFPTTSAPTPTLYPLSSPSAPSPAAPSSSSSSTIHGPPPLMSSLSHPLSTHTPIQPHPSPTSLFRDGSAPVFRACASAMQRPTLSNVRIRSTRDAAHIFLAVAQNRLPMTVRRLDAEERRAIVSGNVYVWEERGANSEATGLGIERWTDGMRWSPSRVRDDFLFYHQKEMDADEAADLPPTRFARIVKPRADSTSDSPSSPAGPSTPPTSANNNDGSNNNYNIANGASSTPARTTNRSSDPQRLIKQTYSVIVELPEDRARRVVRKWHLTAYFTQATVEQLSTVDRELHTTDVVVPEGWFRSARTGKQRRDARDGRDRGSAAGANSGLVAMASSSSGDGGSGGPFSGQHQSQAFGAFSAQQYGQQEGGGVGAAAAGGQVGGHVGAFALGAVHPGPQPYGRAQEWQERYVPSSSAISGPQQEGVRYGPFPMPPLGHAREGMMEVDGVVGKEETIGMDVDVQVEGDAGMDVDVVETYAHASFPPPPPPPPPPSSTFRAYQLQAQQPPPPPFASGSSPISASIAPSSTSAPTVRVPYASTTRERVARAALRLNTGAVSIGALPGTGRPRPPAYPSHPPPSQPPAAMVTVAKYPSLQPSSSAAPAYPSLPSSSSTAPSYPPPPPSYPPPAPSYPSQQPSPGASSNASSPASGSSLNAQRRYLPVRGYASPLAAVPLSASGMGPSGVGFPPPPPSFAGGMARAPVPVYPSVAASAAPVRVQEVREREKSASPAAAAVVPGLGLGLYSAPPSAAASAVNLGLNTGARTPLYGPHLPLSHQVQAHVHALASPSPSPSPIPCAGAGGTQTAPASPERLLVPLDALTACGEAAMTMRRREPADERVLRRFQGLRMALPGSPPVATKEV